MYGLTPQQHNEMFAKQEGCCSICGIHQSKLIKGLHVDHCHISKKIRGLLCNQCNYGLGNFKDNIDVIKKAISYLESHNGL